MGILHTSYSLLLRSNARSSSTDGMLTDVFGAVAHVLNSADRCFFETNLVGLCRTGGIGIMSALPNNQATLSDGCAPTESQYFILSTLKRTSLMPSLFAMGLYVPSCSAK
jgi:hypothetical protein